MNRDDYQKLKDIFQSVIDLPESERGAYLDEKCAQDPGLRSEVERLLSSFESGYLEVPAVASFSDGFKNGHQIGHYTIVNKIGAGGMGEVYLAEDGRLGRRVAIKLLPDHFINDEQRLLRFQQEARTVSALNHPNILTIFEFGETDVTWYIVTEFVDGQTLRERLNRKRLSVVDALEIASQTASALTAAHEAGIIHRDIKPENIMVRPDNLVKVLDFGLAKLVDRKDGSISSDAPTERYFKTESGVIMGTVQYMSPEQARGNPTDARTDIWSLGCVIYEIVTGEPPFAGETTADLIAEIVKGDPLPLENFAPEVPARLVEIIAKSLEKDPDERYQTARDLQADLASLKRKLNIEMEIDGSSPALAPLNMHRPDAVTSKAAASTTEISSVEYLVAGMKLHKRTAIALVAGLVALMGVTAYVARTYWRHSNDARFAYANKIKLAVQALETSNLTLAQQLLDETKPKKGEQDLRGFEWFYLARTHAERSASQPLMLVSQGMVDAVAFSPDGKSLATAGGDNAVRIWDVATGNEIRTLSGHTQLISCVAYSVDGRRLITGSFDKTTRAWDVDTGRELFEINAESNLISNLVFLPDGKRIAGLDGSVKFWDAGTGHELVGQLTPDNIGYPLAVSPNGKFFAARRPDHSVVVWDAATGRQLASLGPGASFLNDLKFSPDSKSLLAGSSDGTAILWDVKKRTELRKFVGHVNAIRDVAFSPDGKTIATGGEDDTIRIWDVEKGFEIAVLQGHTGDVIALAFSPDGRKIASGSTDNSGRVWNVPKNERFGVLRGHAASVEDVEFSADSKLLASASDDKTARIWDVATERERLPLSGHTERVNSVSFSPAGNVLATGSKDKTVKLWDVVTGRVKLSFDSGASGAAYFSPDGGSIATAHFMADPDVRLWDASNGNPICSFTFGSGGAWNVEFTKNGKRMTASGGDDKIRLWDTASCGQIWSFEGSSDDEYISMFTVADKLLGFRILNNSRSLAIVDMEIGKDISSILGHNAELTSAILSPDGTRLVTTGDDSLLKIWDVATGQELLAIKVSGGNINSTAFSPDGKILAGAVSDSTIRLWRSIDH